MSHNGYIKLDTLFRKFISLRKYKLIRKCHDYWKKRKRKKWAFKRKRKDRYNRPLVCAARAILESIMIITVSSIIIEGLCIKYGDDIVVYLPLVGLILPFFLAPFIYALLPGNHKTRYRERLRNRTSIEWTVSLIAFYIYAICLFYDSGIKYGELHKKVNNISFEIKASDGTIFNDSSYMYVGQLNEFVFLKNKQTTNNIILNCGTITYIEINHTDKYNNSLIVNSVGKINSLNNKIFPRNRKQTNDREGQSMD